MNMRRATREFPNNQIGGPPRHSLIRTGLLLTLSLLLVGLGSCFGGDDDDNSAPVANAGPDQTVLVGTTVQLDGSNSTDVDGDSIRYNWSVLSVPQRSSAALSDNLSVAPTFHVDLPGEYVFSLIVSDGISESPADTVSVTTTNSAPMADAGPDQTAALGAMVQLDGGGSSDIDNDPLTYIWSFKSVPVQSEVSLDNAGLANPVFVVDRPGTYEVQLVVNDGQQDSDPDLVRIDTLNSRPVAHAGPDQEGLVGNAVNVDGSGSSDADGDPLSYQWALLSTPDGSGALLAEADQVLAYFVPDLDGEYVIRSRKG